MDPLTEEAGPSCRMDPLTEEAGPSCRMDPLTEEPRPSCRMDPLTEEPGPSCRMDPLTEEPGPSCRMDLLTEESRRMDPLTEEPGPSSDANDNSENPANSPGTATQLDIDTIQMEIDRWEEYYDHIKHYLMHGSLQKNSKSVQKSIHNYLIGSDGQLYRNKISKDGVTYTKVLVIRSYEDRLRICKDIHVNTGEEGRHHRRDKMLEIIGRQYYWKGQRRDICECIAACEVCSSGLGAKRRSKPPGQLRDVRSPAKLLKLSTSPLTVHSSIATAKPLLDPGGHKLLLGSTPLTNSPIAVSTSLASIAKWSRAAVTGSGREAASEQQNNSSALDIEDTRESLDVSLPALIPPSSHTLTVGISGLSENSVNTTADDTLLASDGSGTFHSMSSGFQQIFTTIDEPTTSEEVTERTPLSSTASATRIMSSSQSSLATQQGISASCQPEAQLPAENSIYYLLFKLPAEVNNDIFPSVTEAMHMAMKHKVDPLRLMEAAQTCLHQNLTLTPNYSVLVAPSRAAAYVLALATSMLRIDPLCINQQVSAHQSSPLAIIHDACCHNAGFPKTFTHLLGAYNWNLGGPMGPMEKESLTQAVKSNRVAAVLHQPYSYPKWCDHISLEMISTACHAQDTQVAVIVDMSNMPVQTLTLLQFITTLKELFLKGADVVLLPDTELFQGPPHTCVLIGKSSLMKRISQHSALLQSQLGFPLICTPYDLIGTVVAYKTLRDGSLKLTR